MSKRCFTFIQYPIDKKCEHAQVDPSNGYFQPEHVGESCHHFQPLNVESDPHHGIAEMLASMAGAHE